MLGGVERRAVQHAGHFERPADDALSYTDWLNAGLQADAAYASRTICVCDAASGAVEIYVSPSVQQANVADVVDVEAEAAGGPHPPHWHTIDTETVLIWRTPGHFQLLSTSGAQGGCGSGRVLVLSLNTLCVGFEECGVVPTTVETLGNELA